MRFMTREVFKTMPDGTVYQEVTNVVDATGNNWWTVRGALQRKEGKWHEGYILPGCIEHEWRLEHTLESGNLGAPLEYDIIRADVDRDYYIVYDDVDIKNIVEWLTKKPDNLGAKDATVL